MRFWFVILAVSIGAFGLAGCSVVEWWTGKGNIFSLEIGDCYNDPSNSATNEDGIANIDRVSCSELHQYEVYATFELIGSSWPGMSTVSGRAEEGCLSRFASFVGMGYADSEWYGSYFYPTQDSWNRGNDREVSCSVTPEYGKTIGSARGTRR